MTCWAPVPEAATSPTEPARAALAKPSATPPTTAVPQSGPISSTSAAAAASLSAISSSTGTLSEKSITDSPAWTASRASTTALRPGTEMTARLASAAVAAEPMVRGGGASPKPPALAPAALRAARAASSASCPAFTRGVVGAADGHEQVVGADLLAEREAHAGEQAGVELGGHGDERGIDALGLAHGT